MTKANWCCYLHSENGEDGEIVYHPCEADAELLIVSGYSPEDHIHACPYHVEDLFVAGPFNYVFPLEKEVRMEFPRLAEIVNNEFGEPFLAKGIVDAQVEDDGTFRLRIGPRDIHINDEGTILGTGNRVDESLVWEGPVQ